MPSTHEFYLLIERIASAAFDSGVHFQTHRFQTSVSSALARGSAVADAREMAADFTPINIDLVQALQNLCREVDLATDGVSPVTSRAHPKDEAEWKKPLRDAVEHARKVLSESK